MEAVEMAHGQPINLQDQFLNRVRSEGMGVSIYLVNGVQLKGNVVGFDKFTIILETQGKQQLVFKHAVTTVLPSRGLKDFMKEALANSKDQQGGEEAEEEE
jgi:host factor-I protein